jgi:hypothetical protein
MRMRMSNWQSKQGDEETTAGFGTDWVWRPWRQGLMRMRLINRRSKPGDERNTGRVWDGPGY